MTLLKLLGLRLLAIKHLGYLADEPDIEGRDIQFTTQGSLGEYDIDRLKKIIYLVSNVEKAAKEFPLIIFHFFEDEKLNYMAAVDPSKYKGITINCAKADKMSDIEIYETIVHELIHLLQLKKARIIQKSKRASLYLEIKAKERQKEFGTPNFFLSLEKSIHHFYNFISVEALASYYSKLAARKIKFSERELKSNYSKAKKVCQYFNYLWEKFIAEEDHKKIPILAKKFTSNLVSDDNLNFHLMYTVVLQNI